MVKVVYKLMRGLAMNKFYNLAEEKYKNLKILNGISLVEVLIALTIVGVLAVILIPTLREAMPNQNEVLHKKGTHMVESIVNDLATDPILYPDNDNKFLSNLIKVNYKGKSYEGDTKFCELFASRLNLKPGSTINCENNKKTLTSVDGIDWYLPVTNFTDNNKITIDVNGDKAPNCLSTMINCSNPDQFVYFILPNGKVYSNKTSD